MSLSVQLQALSGQSSYQTRSRTYTPVDGIITVSPPLADDIADLLNMGCVPAVALATTDSSGIVQPDGVTITVTEGVISAASSGGATLLSAITTITDAEVQALGATPITVVAAPGAGKIILPMAAALYVPGVSTYAATLNFSIGSSDVYDWASALSPGTSQISAAPNGNFFSCQGGIFGDNSAWTDQPMTVACTDGITGAGNGIVITIWYLSWGTA